MGSCGARRRAAARTAPRRACGALLGITALIAFAGCASSGRESAQRTELQLAQLARWLPGSYDNRAQVAADRKAGRPPHETVALEIVAVDSLMLGDHVFYEQRADAAAGERVTAQRLFALSLVRGRIQQSVWSLKEPRRWLAGGKDPELFTALQPDDVRQLSGCEITWEVVEGKFSGKDDPQKCHLPAPEGGLPVAVQTRIRLDHDGLDWSERGFDADGKLVYGGDEDSFVQFRRRAAP